MSKDYPWGQGTPKWTRDATANDSDKSFTVPTGKIWLMNAVSYILVTTATVGNRVVTVLITNDADDALGRNQFPVQAASGTVYGLLGFGSNSDDYATGSGSTINQGTAPMIIPAGYKIRVYDVAAVDAAADDLTVSLHYVEYDA